MVKYKTILKAINEYVQKSHQRLSLHLSFPQVEQTFNKFHDKTCKESISKQEHLIGTDNEGNVLYTKDGNSDTVDLGWYNCFMHYEETKEPVHITHNHPRDGQNICAECLSLQDIDNLFLKYDGTDFFGHKTREPVYPIKSNSCESSNGTRMTLTRGDKFTPENEKKAHEIGKQLVNYWSDYYDNYYSYSSKIASRTDVHKFRTFEDYKKYVHKETIKKVGVFEKNKEFKDIQKDFRNLDCQLTYTHIGE